MEAEVWSNNPLERLSRPIRHCEGAILFGDLRDQATFSVQAPGRGIPLVGLWQGSRAPDIPVVNVDNRAGIRLAV